MPVIVKLHGDLRKYLPPVSDRLELDVGSAADVQGVLKSLGIPDNDIWMVSVNGEIADRDRVLGQGDVVDVFAPIAGGQFPSVSNLGKEPLQNVVRLQWQDPSCRSFKGCGLYRRVR